MSGCELPVIINSGSGNQGITASVPVIEYAKELKCGEEKMYRALVLSNLIAIHQKTESAPLSALLRSGQRRLCQRGGHCLFKRRGFEDDLPYDSELSGDRFGNCL